MAVVALNAVNKDIFGFDPRTIGACSLWLDGSDPNGNGSLPANGSVVSTWRDKSGVGNNATGINNPTYVLSERAVTVTGTQYFTTNYSGSLSNETVFIVGTVNLASYSPNASSIFFPSADGGRQLYLNVPNGFFSVARKNAVEGPNSSPTAVPLNQYNILGFSNNSNTMTLFVNTVGGTPGVLPAFSASTTFIGNGISASNWSGNVREIIAFSATLTSAERQQVEGYLAWKWGLAATRLPATHPFLKVAPYSRVFNPTTVAGCVLWLDAKDTTTLGLNGTSVTTWRDKSGFGNNATAALANAPVYDSVNESVNYNGTSMYSVTPLTALPSSENIFMVVSDLASGGTPSMIGGNPFPSSGFGNRMIQLSQVRMITVKTNVSEFLNTAMTALGTGRLLLNSNNPGTNVLGSVTHFYNGLSPFGNTNTNGTVTPYNNDVSIVTILGAQRGVASSFVNHWKGRIHELIIYQNSSFLTTQRQQLEIYLAMKWGLEGSLPATQAYKTYKYPAIVTFYPNQLSTALSAWWDARDPNNNFASVPSNGAIVSTWTDKSGNNRNGTGVNNPTYSLALSAIEFTGTQYYTTTLSASAASETMFIVLRPTGSSTHTLFGSSLVGGRVLRLNGATIELRSNGQTYIGPSTLTGTTFIVACRYNASASGVVIRLNGTSATIANTAAVSLVAGSTTLIGADNMGGNNMVGFIMEALSYSGSALGLADIQLIEGYLAWKWGLNGNLPTTHQYYRLKP